VDSTGKTQQRRRDRGKPLAGKSTLNRLELTPVRADEGSRYKKITCRTHDVERLLVTLFLQAHSQPPEHIVLDLDSTDDPIHGHQFGRFFHGYYQVVSRILSTARKPYETRGLGGRRASEMVTLIRATLGNPWV
jgi:hypothetical protein